MINHRATEPAQRVERGGPRNASSCGGYDAEHSTLKPVRPQGDRPASPNGGRIHFDNVVATAEATSAFVQPSEQGNDEAISKGDSTTRIVAELAAARENTFNNLGAVLHYVRIAQMNLEFPDDVGSLYAMRMARSYFEAAIRDFIPVRDAIGEGVHS